MWRAARRASTDTALRGVLRDLVQKCPVLPDGPAYRYPSRAWAAFVAAQQPARPIDVAAMQPTVASSAGGAGLLSGARFGVYQVLEPVGRGGMAEVYKGRHPRLERTVCGSAR